MKPLCALLLLMALLCPFFHLSAQTLPYDRLAPHPRLLLKGGGEAAIRKCVRKSPEMRRVYRYIEAEADKMLALPPLERRLTGFRLLPVAREALRRLFYLSFMHRMTGKEAYLRRAEAELTAVCSFTDWNPQHFLDTGELTLAVAISYDWLNAHLHPTTRELVRRAVVEKGFKPSYDRRYNWFLTSEFNWNQVCNGGLTLGALALLDTDRKAATDIINRALTSVPLAMKTYAPDGNYPEGYGYWGYGTTFSVMMLAALESALGTDGGLGQQVGFSHTPHFLLFMTGPTGLAFNYSDSGQEPMAFPAMYWFASRSGSSSLLWNELQFLRRDNVRFTPEEERFLPLILIYGSQFDLSKVMPPTQKVWVGRGKEPVAMVRTDWQPGKGIYLGIKGGTANLSHAHMDAGSFVFDANGVRWAEDMGMQDYTTLEKAHVSLWDYAQNGERWSIYRYANLAHNTLTVDLQRHRADAHVSIVEHYDSPHKLGARLDLTPLFFGKVAATREAAWWPDEGCLRIADSVCALGPQPADIRWTMQTGATPRVVDEHTVMLTREGKRLKMVLESPRQARFRLLDNTPPHPYDASNPNLTRVVFDVTLKAGERQSLVVRLEPL